MYFEASSNGASIFADKIHDYSNSNTDLTVFINLATRNKLGELKDVHVQVEDQVVTLTGKVPSWEIYHLVRDVVRYTLGVIDVRNMLLVDLSQDACIS